MRILDTIKNWTGSPTSAPTFSAQRIPPRFLFLQINKRCNLKCTHCVFWQDNDDDQANYLSREGRRRVMREFHAMNPRGAVVICGGETMLSLDEYFDISRTCRSLGLTCLSVANGTRIRDAGIAERLIVEGPQEISISLNSQRRELHDETRGVSGSFDKAVGALRHLIDARRRVGGSTKIYVMGLIFDKNYREIEEFYDFVLNDVGADKLKLNFMQPTFGYTALDDFFANNHDIDPDELIAIVRRCNERFKLGLNPAWMANVRMYFQSLQNATGLERGWSALTQTKDHICNTYERNIMVDHYGVARLCFSTSFRGAPLREDGDLRRFWTEAEDVRQEMRGCNRLCGISHSVRRLSSTQTPAAYTRVPDPMPMQNA